jgi:aerobic carbon-monoxide dehydrogenase large subunit
LSDAYGPRPRREDARLIRGQGKFIDDISLPGMLHAAILRSPLAHARITSVDVTAALAHPKVAAALTGADLQARGLAWMPTLSGDAQAVLATDKIRFQGQELAFVVATDRYAARDALELIAVEADPLTPVVDPRAALRGDGGCVREGPGNKIFDWSAGDKAAAEAAFARADVVVTADMTYPRIHPAPLETCGAVADYDPVQERLTLWVTTQAPHPHRTIYAALTGLPEHKIRVVAPDLGGGFGGKVPVYPGYVCAIVASMMTGRPVKWVEDRSENLMSTAFARDFHMHGEIAATADGRITGLRARVLADHGAFNAVAQPAKYPAGFFHVFTSSYDIPAAYCELTAVYTNKAPGGVAYSCSIRVAEAVYLTERLVDMLARRLGMDPARLRERNLIQPGQFPYKSATGWEYDSGDYPRALRLALELAGYQELRAEQARRRECGECMGIGISFFTEAVGAGPRKHMDIAGLGMADGADLRIHPSGKAVLGVSVQTQGQGHETTFAQLVAAELGMAPEDVEVVHGDTDRTPFGLGTYGSRSTPVSGAAAVIAARRVRERAKIVAAVMLEAAEADLEWADGAWRVRGDYAAGYGIAEIARAAHGDLDLPEGVDGHLDASAVYNPPNLTFPFGAYVCVTDVDPRTGSVTVRRLIAVDDCGIRVNPMIVEGQIHRGLADGVGIALMQAITFDESGNFLAGSFMDYMLPTSLEVPSFELGATVTPSPHHPVGAKGVGESATVGSPPAVVNSVIDALAPFGVVHADMPLTPAAVWAAIQAASGGRHP